MIAASVIFLAGFGVTAEISFHEYRVFHLARFPRLDEF